MKERLMESGIILLAVPAVVIVAAFGCIWLGIHELVSGGILKRR